MKKILLIITLCLFPMTSFAKGFGKFGLEDNLHVIQPIEFKMPNGENYDLAYHTQTRYFLAGVYISKKGYALKVRGEDRYKPLDDATKEQLTLLNILPNPLPEFKLSAMDYVFGYSLWIIIAVLVLWGLMKTALSRKKDS